MKRGMLVALTWLMLIVCATTAIAGATPSITKVTPNIGPVTGGQTVTITGAGFTGATQVTFESINGANIVLSGSAIFVDSDNSMIVTTPDARGPLDTGYGTFDVRVCVPLPPSDSTKWWSPITVEDRYSFVPSAVVNEVSPSVGNAAGGTVVTLTGDDFTGADQVSFDGKVGTNMVVDTNNQITVTAPPGPVGTTVPVYVLHSGVTGQSFGTYTWIANPSVSKVSPNSGSVNGGNTVTISGKYFLGTTSVKFGNTEATSFNVVNANKITAVVPAGTGKVDVQVTNAIGSSDTATSNDDYNYVQVPVITGLTPTSGSYLGSITDPSVHPNADIIDILGYGFTGASQVAVGPNVVLAKDFISITDNKISIYAPALNKNPYQPGKPKTVDIQVTAAGGVSAISNSDKYTYIAVPKIYSLSPSKGQTDGGTDVIITGIGLTGTSKVTFGDWVVGDEATITSVISDTQVKVVTPQEDAGPVWVQLISTGGNTAQWTNKNKFTYIAIPVVDSIAPIAGPTTGGTVVTITGKNLLNAQNVMFGSKAATITSVTKNQITVTSPAEAPGTVDVTVVSPSGTSLANDRTKFTYDSVNVVPTVTKVAPKSGIYTGGNTVTVYGSGFTGATLVNFGSKSGSNLAVTSDTKLTVTAPAGTGTVDIAVVTPGGVSPATSKDRYTYLSMPVVSSVSPTYGPVKGGNTVLIYGTNFKGVTSVSFGAKKVTSLSVNTAGTRITLKAPAVRAKGTVDVTVRTRVGISSTSATTKYIYV